MNDPYPPGLYEATQRIYAVSVPHSKDRWIAPGERFVVGGMGPWESYPDDQVYYDLIVGSQAVKVLLQELQGKAKKVPILPVSPMQSGTPI